MKYKRTKHKIRKLFKTSEQNIYDVNIKKNKDFILKAQTLLFKNVKVLHSDIQEVNESQIMSESCWSLKIKGEGGRLRISKY